MSRSSLFLAPLMVAVLAAPAANAQTQQGEVVSVQPSGAPVVYTDYAEVLRVEPLRRRVRVSSPVEQCWDEPVYHSYHGHSHGYRSGSFTSPIVGGILGGLVGNQFGKGDGRTLLTVAGAVLGASAGRDYGHRRYRSHRYHTYAGTERHCRTTYSYHDEDRDDGYLVDYRYKGKVYTARTDFHPGERMKVDVRVLPRN